MLEVIEFAEKVCGCCEIFYIVRHVRDLCELLDNGFRSLVLTLEVSINRLRGDFDPRVVRRGPGPGLERRPAEEDRKKLVGGRFVVLVASGDAECGATSVPRVDVENGARQHSGGDRQI